MSIDLDREKTGKYRPGVVGVFVRDDGKVLVCERSNLRGVWQFPQGGIDPGESEVTAILREMREELGTDKFKLMSEGQGWTYYDFPADATFPLAKTHKGQRHFWFLLKFNDACGPVLDTSDGEFVASKWVEVDEVISSVVAWKRDSYSQGLTLLGLRT